ncbi:MAG: 30S ribosomal protein S1 [Planctomycetota bacterium]|nr:MAG: 30S ribosomal protein S1 [Planctomycetota bacterium]
MRNTNPVRRINVVDDQLMASELEAAQADQSDTMLMEGLREDNDLFAVRSIVTGFVVGNDGTEVCVDIGYKSEAYINIDEFAGAEVNVGDKVQVMVVDIESNGDLILSKRQADLELGWQNVLANKNEGERVVGTVVRKIKGGLLVDIGVPVFLPASQIDLRRANDVGEYIGEEIEAEIIKIDIDRKNIVISRRRVLEEERRANREALVSQLQVGDLREGVVKNITDFGAFIDLGGLDGLLHITDMSWGRVNHPSEIVKINQSIEVVVLDYDAERGRISLGLKQKTRNPWEDIEQRYPPKSIHHGHVVNLMNYGAFVKLEDGIEGLVHVSEMTWGKQPTHPNELLKAGQEVNVMVLEINHEKQEISLGIKQAEKNPWEDITSRYSIGTKVKGPVTSLTNYGAFVELEEGIEGLLHVNDISWTKKLTHPSPELKKDDVVECIVLGVDEERQRISLGKKQLEADPWEEEIPDKVKKGDTLAGKVAKITNFGVFVEILDGIEGLLHVSELPDELADDPENKLAIGQEIEVKVINIDYQERKIGLSMK